TVVWLTDHGVLWVIAMAVFIYTLATLAVVLPFAAIVASSAHGPRYVAGGVRSVWTARWPLFVWSVASLGAAVGLTALFAWVLLGLTPEVWVPVGVTVLALPLMLVIPALVFEGGTTADRIKLALRAFRRSWLEAALGLLLSVSLAVAFESLSYVWSAPSGDRVWVLAGYGSVQGTGFMTPLFIHHAIQLSDLLGSAPRPGTSDPGTARHVGGAVFRLLYSAFLMCAYGLFLAKLYRRADLNSAPSTPGG
ncbi:MAG: hypothetical protein O7C98_04455, partial [Planctomycetota bacterium]|nr:hypothetical protein [Planctomycetota bacterium]